MTNFEMILENEEKFIDWAISKGSNKGVLKREFFVLAIGELIDCKDCPFEVRCYDDKGSISCRDKIRKWINKEYEE